MQQVKIFDDVEQLNKWLEKNDDVRIIQMNLSKRGSLAVTYEEIDEPYGELQLMVDDCEGRIVELENKVSFLERRAY
ncbi:hypothetical protein [Tetragenococcus solitarius]|uniref:Uncharacterized protein n=1 Tax=Tetragenococcus solitarius TaxID=71453 RepID=A0ABN3YCV1_9ENTE|nr:hypothetical protein [Tetragenococcus solitarius]